MFATLLRRWRIVTPVVTALVALSFVISAFIVPASASSLHFRFSGDAADFINYSTSPAYFDCFSGWLSKSGGSLSGHSPLSNGCFGVGYDVSGLSVFADLATWDIQSTNSSTGGHVTSSSEVFGLNDESTDGVVVRLEKDYRRENTIVREFLPLVSSEDVDETVVASCHAHGSGEQVSTAATVNLDHLAIINGGVYAEEASSFGTVGNRFTTDEDAIPNSDEFDTIADAAGSANESVVITRSFTVRGFGRSSEDFILIVTTNDFSKWTNGNEAAISGNGLHVVIQAEDGEIASDLVLAHAHADIECAHNLHSFTDPLGW